MFDNKFTFQWYLSYDKEKKEFVYLMQLPLSLYSVIRQNKESYGYIATIYQKLETGDEIYDQQIFNEYSLAKNWIEAYILQFVNHVLNDK